jgi:hypothetical protein
MNFHKLLSETFCLVLSNGEREEKWNELIRKSSGKEEKANNFLMTFFSCGF